MWEVHFPVWLLSSVTFTKLFGQNYRSETVVLLIFHSFCAKVKTGCVVLFCNPISGIKKESKI